jgi:hypothetical protein
MKGALESLVRRDCAVWFALEEALNSDDGPVYGDSSQRFTEHDKCEALADPDGWVGLE